MIYNFEIVHISTLYILKKGFSLWCQKWCKVFHHNGQNVVALFFLGHFSVGHFSIRH